MIVPFVNIKTKSLSQTLFISTLRTDNTKPSRSKVRYATHNTDELLLHSALNAAKKRGMKKNGDSNWTEKIQLTENSRLPR
jgi:hypothetical protein